VVEIIARTIGGLGALLDDGCEVFCGDADALGRSGDESEIERHVLFRKE
jgi:hypothetical protein